MEKKIREHYNAVHGMMLEKGYTEKALQRFECKGEAGIYLLRCCELPNSKMRVYKPGITGTNINLIKNKKGVTQQMKNDYISVMKAHFKSHYKSPSKIKTKKPIEQQFKDRNGNIHTQTHITSAYESKEDFLPVIFRFETTIFIAWFFENIITLINSTSITFKHKQDKISPKDLKYFCYNGYALKALYPSTSINRNESVIFGLDYELKFFKLMVIIRKIFQWCKHYPVINDVCNKEKIRIYTKFYNKFKNKHELTFESLCIDYTHIVNYNIEYIDKINDFKIPSTDKEIVLKSINSEQKNKCNELLKKYRKYIDFDVIYGRKVDYSIEIEKGIDYSGITKFVDKRHYTLSEVFDKKGEKGIELIIKGIIQNKWTIENRKWKWF